MAQGPCWDGYVQVGMKKKNGKEVPNCVPSKKAKRSASIEQQTESINASALEIVEAANSQFSGTRLVTKKAALTVVARSVSKNESDPFSVRKHKALAELSHYITLAQSNKSLAAVASNTDLLPIAHPKSTRDHELTLESLIQHRARWITDDPDIKDDTARTLLASALTSHPASVEYEYAITHLSTMPQGMVPQYALVAAFGDGNSSAARRARAMLQRRDRKGRFAEMGGGLRALIKRAANGLVQSLTGTAVSQGINGDTFDMELPNGKLVRVPASSAEAIKAILPSMQTKDGYSKTPAKFSTGDPVINESDLEVVDAPDGFTLDDTWSPTAEDVDYYGTKIDLGKKYTDDAYDVVKFEKPNIAAKNKFEAEQQKEAEGNNVVTLGKGKDGWLDPNKPVYFISRRDGKDKNFAATQSWADVQDVITQDEPKYEKGEPADPSVKTPTKKVSTPKGGGPKDPDDPDDSDADSSGPLKAGDYVPTPIDLDKYDGDFIPGNPKAKKGEIRQYTKQLKDFEKNGGLFPLDPRKDHLILKNGTVINPKNGRVLRDSKGMAISSDEYDVPSGSAPSSPSAKPKAIIPAKQDDFDYPEGSYKLQQGVDYTPEGAVEGQVSPDFTDDPAELAQKYETEELTEALRQSVSGTKDKPAPGYGALPFEAGDELVPAEALYNALKEKGEDADAILGDIYGGGKSADVTPEVSDEVKEAIGGEDVEDVPTVNDEGDPSVLPPLLEGLSEDEKANYAETGDYKKYLPKNENFEVPTGYTELNEDPFNLDEAVLPEDAPDGFTYDPVEIAKFYDKEGLIGELRRALEPDNYMPGSGMLSQKTPEGEDYIGYVPGEAIRDALQLQGEDTNALSKDIYAEGADSEPTPQEVDKALEGDAPETTEGTPTKQEAPTESSEPIATNEAGSKATTVNTGEPTGPAKLKAKVTELKAGDITARDFFTITKVEPTFDKKKNGQMVPASQISGYFPGGVEQTSKVWANDAEIEVYRNVDGPTQGDLPELNQPEMGDYGKLGKLNGEWVVANPAGQKEYEEAYAKYKAQLDSQKALWSVPEGLEDWQTESAAPAYTPENPIGVTEVASVDVKAGDITFKKEGKNDFYEFFVVEGVSTDEQGNAVVQGYYPGHESQTKTWKGTTKIQVIKGATAPEAGTKPALERPKKDDPDFAEKKAAFDAAKKESAATWTAPIDLEASAPKPKAKKPASPSFQGEKLKAIAEAAGGDPKKFKELLAQEEVVHIDFETTGVSFDSPSPIQVALVKTKNGEVIDSKNLFMNPEELLGKYYTDKEPSEILKDSDGNPISDAFLEKQMSQEEAFKQIMEFMGPNPIVSAHNMPFDGGILKSYVSKFGMDYEPSGEIDTLSLSRKVINGGNGDHVLQAVANRYDLAGPDTDWHDASVDVAVLPAILDNLLDEMAITNSGVDTLDFDKSKTDFDAANAQYMDSKSKKAKSDTELVMAKTVADSFAGKEDIPTTEELTSAVPKDLPTSEELSSATTPNPSEVSDNDSEIESILGGLISNNWVSENENTTSIGKVAVEDMKPGDFISAQYGGYHEIISIEPDPDNDKKMIVTRRLITNGKEYQSSWIKYQGYEVRRRNEPIEFAQPEDLTPETPEVEQPILETDEAPEKESSAGTWSGYNIAQGTDGVYYAENISATDVQALRNGELTPPQLPFFAPLGGGNDQETGEGYFFSANGKRFWGKYGAAGALVRRKNSDGVYEYFLAKRSSGLSQGGGKWGFPGGAHKDQTIAKSVGATAKEEFNEEVGGDLSSLDAKYVHQNFVGPEWSYDTYVFEVGPKQLGELTPKDGENSEIGWFTADQINQMAADGKLHTDFADSAQAIFDLSEDNTKGPEKPTPAESKSTEIKAFDTTNWKKIAGQAGSNDGAFYVDPDTGEQYYVKKPKSDKHAANEALASALYAEAGTKIGRVYLGKDKSGKTVLVSPLVENSKKDFSDKKSDSAILKSAQEDFAVDAWLNNYDSVGLSYDNMLTVDKDVYRVDPGGSLLFRAQGKDKSKDLTDDVKSVDSLRDGSLNSESADIFGSMTDEQIAESAKKVQAISPEKIDELVDQAFPDDLETASFLKEKLKARREDLIKRFGLEPQEKEEVSEPIQSVSDSNPVTPLDPSGDLAQQLNDSVGKKVSFLYNGKDRVVTVIPSKEGTAQIWENPKNGKINVRVLDSDGVTKVFTIANMEANSEGFEAPKEAPKPSTEAPSGWNKEGNYTWKKDGWVVTEDTEGKLTGSNPEVSGLIFGDSWDEVQTKIDAEDTTPSIPQVSTPEEIKAIAESPDGGITPSANDDITPVNPEPEANPTPADKPTEVPAAAKKKLLDDLSNLAEQVFGKAPSKDALKSLLNSLKEQGGDSDLIDSVVSDIDGPKPLETPADKVAEDIAQDLTPETDGGELATPAPLDSDSLSEILSNPDETNPELIWNQIKKDYDGSVLDSGHIVVHSVKHGDVQYDVVVRRNEDNSFSVYHRITNPDGSTKAYVLKRKNHSAKALKNSISAQIYNANFKPSGVKTRAKAETAKTLLPTSFAQVPTEKESYVAADGTVLKKGDMILVVKPGFSKSGKTGKITQLIRTFDSTGYGYTDYVKVNWGGGDKNKIVSNAVVPIDSDFKWGDTPSTTPSKPTPSTPSTSSTPSSPATSSTSDVELPKIEVPSLGDASKVSDVEALALDKNSDKHVGYFGAADYSDYKQFLKGKFVKDLNSKNIVPGIIVQNADLSSDDDDLTSYGVVTSTKPSVEQAGGKMTDPELTVSYFDGPLAGKSATLKSDKVWSREKFLTNEQAEELGITVDPTLRDLSRAAAIQKGEQYKQQIIKQQKAAEAKKIQEAEAKALKDLKQKDMVAGPGFELKLLDAPANWSASPVEAVPSLDTALRTVKGSNPVASTNGVAILGDADEIEDSKIKVQKVLDSDGEEKIRLTFNVTRWKAKKLLEENLDKNPDIKKSNFIQMTQWIKDKKTGLISAGQVWGSEYVDYGKNGRTLSGDLGDGATFQLHRANKSATDDDVDFTKYYSSSKYSVSLHNKAEILLPADASSEDIAKALSAFGITSAKPATKESLLGMIENKMIWNLGGSPNGEKNITGELRQKILKKISDEYGFTASDVEIVPNASAPGSIEFLMPESTAELIVKKTGKEYFKHQLSNNSFPNGEQAQVNYLYDMFVSGGLFATANRWNNGMNFDGASSKSDLKANGGNYIFAHKSDNLGSTTNSGNTPVLYFEGKKILRRLGFYSTPSDDWGQLKGDDLDIVKEMKSASQFMFKDNLTWADLANISMSSAVRKLLIEKLTQNNNNVIGSVDVIDILSGKKKKGSK